MSLKIGDTIQYYSYGQLKTATILRESNGLLFLDNKRWIDKDSVIAQKELEN